MFAPFFHVLCGGIDALHPHAYAIRTQPTFFFMHCPVRQIWSPASPCNGSRGTLFAGTRRQYTTYAVHKLNNTSVYCDFNLSQMWCKINVKATRPGNCFPDRTSSTTKSSERGRRWRAGTNCTAKAEREQSPQCTACDVYLRCVHSLVHSQAEVMADLGLTRH